LFILTLLIFKPLRGREEILIEVKKGVAMKIVNNVATSILTALLGAGLASAVSASTSYYEADVLQSTAIFRAVETSTPRQECWLEEVVRESRPQYRSNTPNILGAVIGGAIGNAVGHNKSNQRVGAVVGAVLGASVARDISYSNRNRNRNVYYETVERCETVYDSYIEDRLVGYDVVYSYNNREYTVRTQRDPGATIRVRVNVEPVL
jgi:uncharacterized protein YcfJ